MDVDHIQANEIGPVQDFLLGKWRERAAELGRPQPTDLSGACKFCSAFAHRLYGGDLRGNYDHQWVEHPEHGVIDLTGNPQGFEYAHDPEFWMNPEHGSSLESIRPRVDNWYTEYGAWGPDSGRDVTAAFIGITTPYRELIDEIHKRGWTVNAVKVKNHEFVAEAKNPHGEKLTATGPNESTAVGHLLTRIMRREWARTPPHRRKGNWQPHFDSMLAEIAQAYAEAKLYDPKAAIGFKDLADDSRRRLEHIQAQLHIEIVHDPAPYKMLNDMLDDVQGKQHLFVSDYNAHHPLWSVEEVIAFRAVHDVLGHCAAGGDWGWHGANLAFGAHAPLLHPDAQKALFTETLGQGAFNSFYRTFGPQKIVYLNELMDKIQADENKPGHSGIHPSQSLVPGKLPAIPKDEDKKTAAQSAQDADPNYGWQSNVDPLPDNAFLWQKTQTNDGRVTDPLDVQGLRDHADAVQTGWHDLRNPDGGADVDTMRQAVANAFRAVLSQPRRTRRANAQHYQGIMNIPATVHDPMRYWDALDRERDAHNQARNLPAQWHVTYTNDVLPFKQWLKSIQPTLDDKQIDAQARRELFHMLAEEEERIAKDDVGDEYSTDDIERDAMRNLQKRLKVITKGNPDHKYDFEPERLYFEAAYENDIAPYPAPLASHVKSIAAVGHRVNDLLKAARDDVKEGGTGHSFRAKALGLKLPGIGPREASYAWMLLNPHSSQLAVVSPQVLEALGHKPEDMNPRDYFKFERELASGRDAAGYGHLPLGLFSWGVHDHFTYGPGSHHDHTHMRVMDPLPHSQVDWKQAEPTPGSNVPSYWWDSTQPMRDQAGKNWDRAIAVRTPSTDVPYTKTAAGPLIDPRVPTFTDPNGEVVEGKPGQSMMEHIRSKLGVSTLGAWKAIAEADKR